MKLHYLLYFVIGSVASRSTESLKGREGTLEKQPKECGSYKKDNVYDGESNIFQNIFEGTDDINDDQISTITERVQNVTEQINRFHKTGEKIFPLDTIPLFFIQNSTSKLRETVNTYLNQNAQKHTPHSANFQVHELGQMHPNYDLQESKETDYKLDVQEQLRNDSAPYFRRVMQLGLTNRPQRTSKMYFLQQMLKDYRISAPPHGMQNAWKISESDYKTDSRETVQSGITHDLEELILLEREHNHTANMTNDFPKRINFKPVHDNHSYEVNRDSGIQSRVIPSIVESKVRILSMLRHSNLTDSPTMALYLNNFQNPKKHDVLQYYQNMVKIINNCQHDRKDDFGIPDEVDQTRDARKCRFRTTRESFQLNSDNIMKELAEFMPSSTQRKKLKAFPRHILTKTVRTPKPNQLNLSPNMRKPVQLNPVHNMREPVKVHPTHYLQKPVQLDPTHDMRSPVQLHPSHDLRRPVKVEPTHDLRRPVKIMESHDLRWPVIEVPDHNMRNPITEIDTFGSEDEDGKLRAFIRGQVRKLSKNSFAGDPLYELLYEDEFIFLKCSRYQVNFNPTKFSARGNSRNEVVKSVTKYGKLFNESIKACGIPFNHSMDILRKETKLTKWPWMVSLQEYILNKFWHKCAGSLINNLWVITAAHCVESKPKWDFLLQLGMNEDSRNYIERFVDRMTIHPKFNSLSLDHDIALIRMDVPVTFQSNIVPICLPWKTDEIEKKKAVALAWRLDKEKNDFDELSREKTVPVLTNKECEVMFSETGSSESIQKSFLCASFENVDQDSCGGDSGGPLVILDDDDKWILAGIYSWGKSCKTPNQPEVYIRISRYTEWIENTIICYEENIRLYRMD